MRAYTKTRDRKKLPGRNEIGVVEQVPKDKGIIPPMANKKRPTLLQMSVLTIGATSLPSGY
jgi:hypothetical protein